MDRPTLLSLAIALFTFFGVQFIIILDPMGHGVQPVKETQRGMEPPNLWLYLNHRALQQFHLLA